jgi:hypothetical protein
MSADPSRDPGHDPTRLPVLFIAALAAAAGPSLLAHNVSPSPTFWNQALALGLWGGFVMLLAAGPQRAGGWAASRAAAPVQLALLLFGAAALWSGTRGSLPSALCLSALGLLGATALLVHSGAAARGSAEANTLFALFCGGWLVAGVLNLGIGLVQVFAPDWPDGEWIAASGIVGRAVGNLRQPNHLSSLLLWSAIAAVALLQLRRVPRALGIAAFAAMIFGVVLTASRTGLVSVGVLALWGLPTAACRGRRGRCCCRRRCSMRWPGSAWRAGPNSASTPSAVQRLAETDVSGSRFGIWGNTLSLIRAQPWTGVGFGEFNLAWSLTPFPGRPTAFFDHTHNLPLQLAVELGLPLAGLILLLLLWGLARMALLAWRADGDDGCHAPHGADVRADDQPAQPAGVPAVVRLLPAAGGLGLRLRDGGLPQAAAALRRGVPLLAPAGRRADAAGGVRGLGLHPRGRGLQRADGAPPLAQRIERGQRSVFFAHHADYAAATTETEGRSARACLCRRTHYLLDTRLMMAWADELAAQGDVDRGTSPGRAAARVQATRWPRTSSPPCDEPVPPAGAALPVPPPRAHGWRDWQATCCRCRA